MKPMSSPLRPGSLTTQNRRTSAPPARLQLEVLEDRTVPAIVFANRGQPSDTFTPAEHALIDRAIQIWENRITIPQTINITFLGGSTSGLVLPQGGDAAGDAGDFQVPHQIPTGFFTGFEATVRIVGTLPGGQQWFIDPTPQDNAEFTPLPNNPFAFDPGQPETANSADMLSVIEHEIGHILGFYSLSLEPFLSEQGVFTGPDGFQAFFSGDGSHLDPAVYSRDLMLPSSGPGREFPSDTDVHVLLDTYSSYRPAGSPPIPIPVTGDWSGTGQTQVGLVDPDTNTWFLNTSSGVISFPFNEPGFLPVTGDWTGTGKTQVGLVDPVFGNWFLNTASGLISFKYGSFDWLPVTGDWTGTGQTQVGAVDPETATWYLNTADGGGNFPFQFGLPGWTPVTGDWTGTGKTQVGMVDPATNTWYLNTDSGVVSFPFGLPGWKPVTGDWTGTGKTQVGVVDTATNTWYLNTDTGVVSFPFGLPSAQPASAQVTGAALPKGADQSDPVVSAAILAGGDRPDQRHAGLNPVLDERTTNLSEPFGLALPPASADQGDGGSPPAALRQASREEAAVLERPMKGTPGSPALDAAFAGIVPGEHRSEEEG